MDKNDISVAQYGITRMLRGENRQRRGKCCMRGSRYGISTTWEKWTKDKSILQTRYGSISERCVSVACEVHNTQAER